MTTIPNRTTYSQVPKDDLKSNEEDPRQMNYLKVLFYICTYLLSLNILLNYWINLQLYCHSDVTTYQGERGLSRAGLVGRLAALK